MKKTKLTVIMFTDIFGFSQMMELNESKTIEALESHNHIVFPLVEKYEGRIVDTVGDGLLIVFESALNATECAVNIQNAVTEHNLQTDKDMQFQMRIGMHLGDIWYDNDRIFGNGVNIAARIEPFALPGGICISEDMYNQVCNKISLDIRSIGTKQLKNIERNLQLYHIITGFEEQNFEVENLQQEDARRQKLLEAREQVRTEMTNSLQKAQSTETALEQKVLGFVDKVMDKAIDKWDKLPEEKKSELVSHVDDNNISISIGNSGKKTKLGKSLSDMLPLTIFVAAFGVGIFHFGIGWMWIPFLLFCIGWLSEFGSVIKNLNQLQRNKKRQPLEYRQKILQCAQKLDGRVTVVKIAAKTGLDIDLVQNVLDDMVAKGYIVHHLEDNGVLHYEFPE